MDTTEMVPPRQTQSHWIKGLEELAHKKPKEIAHKLTKIITDTPNLYSLTIHTTLGVHVTTVIEETDGKD